MLNLGVAMNGVDSKYQCQRADEGQMQLVCSADRHLTRIDVYRLAEDRFWVLRFDLQLGVLDSEPECGYQELPPECRVVDHLWRPGAHSESP